MTTARDILQRTRNVLAEWEMDVRKAERSRDRTRRRAVRLALGAAASLSGISVHDFLAYRSRKASLAKQAVYWICHDCLGLSYPEAGVLLGKDHTTVMYGAKRFRDALSDPSTRELADRIATKIDEGMQ